MKPVFSALLLLLPAALQCQPVMPSWLAAYPGATAQTSTSQALVETTYTTSASPAAVQEHYRKLFEAHTLPFVANEDGVGVVIRASAECDLMLSIRPRGTGSSVRVSCAGKSAASSDGVTTATVVTTNSPPRPAGMSASQRQQYDENVAKALELHRQKVAEMGIHKAIPAAPAPPLVWPRWLVAPKDSVLEIARGKDQAENLTLSGTFITGATMTSLAVLYKNLLTSHGYSYRSMVETGHTQSGIQQNALGYVEGDNYPDGTPGPRTEIHVGFYRRYLNDPITVTIRFTTYAYRGSGPREP